MVVDTSALLAVLFDEPEREPFIELLADAEDPLISAATLLESSIVMQAKTGNNGDLAGANDYRDVLAEVLDRRFGVGDVKKVFPDHTHRRLGVMR